MNKKIFISTITIVLIIACILLIINRISIYNKAINNVKEKYNIIFNTTTDFNISGNLKSEHTSNLVHSINQVYEKDYSISIEKKEEYLYVYLDDKVSKIEIEKYYNIFDINNISECDYISKDKDLINKNKVNKYNYSCNLFDISIYSSKIFNNYIKTEIKYDDVIIEFSKDKVEYTNNYLTLNYSNIREDNYGLNIKLNNEEIKMFYTYDDNYKYSFLYNNNKFNIIIGDNIIFSMNCNIQKYSKLKLTLTKDKIDKKDKYEEVIVEQLFSTILSPEIYALFNNPFD